MGQSDFYSYDEKKVPVFQVVYHHHRLTRKNHAYLTDSQYSTISLTTTRVSHSSSMNTSLGESSKFPMLSISIPSNPSSIITFFSEGLSCLLQWKRRFFQNKTTKIKQVKLCKRGLLDFISYIFISVCFI